MKFLSPTLLILSASLALAETSQTIVIQPEIVKVSDDVVRQIDDAAMGGEYVTHMREYNPLFYTKADVVEGDPVAVWARVKGMAIQVKGIHGDEQVELDWNWSSPADWSWVKLGEYSRDRLGDALLIIRGAEAPDGAGLDAVALSTDGTFDPGQLSSEELEALGGE